MYKLVVVESPSKWNGWKRYHYIFDSPKEILYLIKMYVKGINNE